MASFERRLWYVQGFNDRQQSLAFCLPLRTSGKQIQTLLQRLASRHLSPEQLVALARQKQTGGGLRPRVSDRSRISLDIADGRHSYVAQIVSEFQLSELRAQAR